MIVARQRWSTAKPIEFNKTDLKDPNVISTEEVLTCVCFAACGSTLTHTLLQQIVTALAHWATPKFRRTARRDTELPDDPEEFMEQFDRFKIVLPNPASYFRLQSALLGKHFDPNFAHLTQHECQEGNCLDVHEDG